MQYDKQNVIHSRIYACIAVAQGRSLSPSSPFFRWAFFCGVGGDWGVELQIPCSN
jgi:hypothetical protein